MPYFVSLVASSRGGVEVLAGDEWERVSMLPWHHQRPVCARPRDAHGGKVFYVHGASGLVIRGVDVAVVENRHGTRVVMELRSTWSRRLRRPK
ncbi:MAG: hypothetical protein U0168_07905 [Nannocystaceae bacterium]